MFAASKTNSASTGVYQISRSLRFNRSDSAYLNRTPASTGSRTTFTFSAWVKTSTNYSGQSERDMITAWNGGGSQWDFLDLKFTSGILAIGGYNTNVQTTAVFRDPSAWYHFVWATDTTQATDTNRFKLYVNGVQQTISGTYPPQNQLLPFNTASVNNNIGWSFFGTQYFDGYMTEVNFIDGQALTPSSFGETNAQTGVWQPKAYSGSYGTNGFYLNFSDNSNTTAATLGKDYSGNGNNWTPNNFSVTAGAGNDSLVDSPTSYGTDTGVGGTVRGNYATLNPLVVFGTSAFTNGNLDVSVSSANTNNFATIAIPTSGKWYWEYQITSVGGGAFPMAGIIATGSSALTSNVVYRTNGDKNIDGTGSAYGATYTTTDIIGVAVDVDGGTITFYKNGTSQGAITYATSSGNYSPALRSNAATDNFTFNFGQRAFANTAPSGFKALCTQNLPTPTIGATSTTLATKYFNPVLYTGNGSTLTVTGVGFQPDWVWLKARSSGGSSFTNNVVIDSVRGSGTYGYKNLYTNTTEAEYDPTSGNASVNSLNSDGFVLGGNSNTNYNTMTAVAWNWKANGTGSTNTSGSITSTVSANTTSGFSIVTYTGTGANATVGHGLGVAPKFIITKKRSSTSNWATNDPSQSNPWSGALLLNSSNAFASSSAVWNDTAPTTTVFSIGTADATNISSATYVAYCFAEVAGYSKFGAYTGNGSGTGPFIYTGFRPAFVLVKNTTSSGPQWWILDNKRNTYNPEDLALPTSLSLAEQTIPTCLNFLSNGFQVTTTNGDFNTSGSNYIFMAIAENPFKYSLAR